MANKGHENLVPQNKRTKAEQRRIASEGGKASGESRRKRKALKESMNALLELPIATTRDFNKVAKMGIPVEDIDNSQLLVVALFNRAKGGDVGAWKELRDLIGEAGDVQAPPDDGDIERLTTEELKKLVKKYPL